MLTPDRPPPEDYYQNNCRVLLEFVRDQYSGYAFMRDFQMPQLVDSFLNTSDDAQRLCARLLTRKGPWFRTDTLSYAEITNLPAAVQELHSTGLVELRPNAPADQLLNLLRKDELLQLRPFPPKAKQLRKAELVTLLLSRYSDDLLRRQVAATVTWLGLTSPHLWHLLRLLYFGERNQDWSAFVLRDLGMIQYQDIPLIKPRHTSSASLHEELYTRRLGSMAQRLTEHASLAPRLASELVLELRATRDDRFLQRRRDKALLRIAQWQEQQGQAQSALDSYALVQLHPARERRVRILKKLQRESECEALLAEMTARPTCEEEAQFAQRFGRRRAGYQPPTTVVQVPAVDSSVEAQALSLLIAEGGWGAHVENSLVRSLTGLLYWPIIFLQTPGAFTNPFQSGPNDLYYEDFTTVRSAEIEALEVRLADDEFLVKHLLHNVRENFGMANQLVNWSLFEQLDIEAIISAIPAADIRKLSAFLIRNLNKRRAGLPDLFVVYGDSSYELVEVKGPNDQLQPGQRVWFEHLARMGIPCRVLKLQLAKGKNEAVEPASA